MKSYKIILSAVLVTVLIIPVTFAIATPKAEAACSYQGYVNSNGKCANSFKASYYYDNYNSNRYQYRNDFFEDRYEARISYLETLIERLQELLALQKELRDDLSENSEIEVRTLSARDVDKDSALLRGDIDFNGSDEAEVWFLYGTNFNDLNKTTSKVKLDDSDEGVLTKTIDDLNDNTIYYFRAVGEDEDGVIDYGSRLSFKTDDDSSGNEDGPEAITNSARNVDSDSAVLRGSVDMNDFNNGRVFFVYGEDEGQVEDVEDDFNTYAEVDEDGKDLQKVLVDSDLDDTETYSREVTSLDDDTRHYYSLCVEFEDEDGDDKLVCGDVEEFETDKD